MTSRIISAAVLIAAPLLASQALADAGQALRDRAASMPHFQARFAQTVVDLDGQLLQEGQGSLAVATPDRFRWHQLAPEESLILSDGDAVSVYDPLLEQVTLYDVDQALVQSPLSLLSQNDPEAWNRYDVSQDNGCFRLVPKEAQQILAMTLCFDDDAINTLALEDSQGLTTTMTLSGFDAESVAEATFKFTPPEGTLIDDQRGQ